MKLKALAVTLLLLLAAGLCIGCTTDTNAPPDSTPETTVGDTDDGTVTEAESETTPEDDVLFRFGVMSDTHIGDRAVGNNMSCALTALKTISDDRLDAMLFAGDLTSSTGLDPSSNVQIKRFLTTYNKQLKGTPFVYCLGPTHDLPPQTDLQISPESLPIRQLYKDTLGNFENDLAEADYVESGIRHAVMNGYHIFTIDYLPSEAGLTKMVEDMRAATAEEADRPIFVILHNPYESYITTLFTEFPQVICFSGHSHKSSAREDSIMQDNGYTQVHIGGTSDHRVDGYTRYNDNPFLNLGDVYHFSQSLYVEVKKDHTVTITRVDGHANTVIGEPWVVGPARRDVYTIARRDTAKPCVFPEGATVSVTESGRSVTVSFGAATGGDAGPALFYRVSLMEKRNEAYVVTQYADLSSQQIHYPNDVGIPENFYQYTFDDVDVDDYGIVVTVMDCWRTSESVLTYSSGNFVYSPARPDDGNIAFGKHVAVTARASYLGDSEYAPHMLTDGLYGYDSNHPDRQRGWDKNPGFMVTEENPIDIVIDLGGTYDIEKVVLHPIVTYTDAFPTYFEYQVSMSENGDDWVTVKVNADVHYNGRLSGSAPPEAYDPDNHYDVIFDEPVTARRFRIHITEPSAQACGEDDCYMGFGELELYGQAADAS